MIPVLSRRLMLLGTASLPLLAGGGGEVMATTVARAQQYLHEREVALRVAERRFAEGKIPYSNVQARQREVEQARAALGQGGGGGGSSSNSPSSSQSASSGNNAQAEQHLRDREKALEVAERRYKEGKIPYSNVQARQREVDEARAALGKGSGGGSISQPNQQPSSPPASGGTMFVSNSSQLAGALRNAKPGNRIVVANGTYSGSFQITTNGQAYAPIVITAANRLGPNIQSTLTVDGNYIRIEGLSFRNSEIQLSGNNCDITRNVFSGTKGGIYVNAASNIEISYNEFTGWSKRGIDVNPRSGSRTSSGINVHHNYLHHPSGGGTVGITIGEQTLHTSIGVRAVIENNLFYKCGMDQVINLKSSQNIVRYNTLIDSGFFVNRHGHGNDFIGNWIENSKGLWLSDQNCEARDNRLIRSLIWVLAGNITPSQVTSQRGGFPRSEDTRLIDNRVDYRTRIGVAFDDWSRRLPATGTRVEGHNGPVGREFEQSSIIGVTNSSSAGKGARKIAQSNVGPTG